MTEVIAASAAVAAAVFSFVNMLVTTRSTRGIEDRRWRRESARQSMCEFLTAIDAVYDAWKDASVFAQGWGREPQPIFQVSPEYLKERLNEAHLAAQKPAAELELVSTARCVKLANLLLFTLGPEHFAAALIAQDDPVVSLRRSLAIAESTRQRFIGSCRVELGSGKTIDATPWFAKLVNNS